MGTPTTIFWLVQVCCRLSFDVALAFDSAVERDVDRFFGMLNLERSAVGLPAVGFLALEAVEDLLAEQAVLVIDAVAEAGHAEGGQRFQEARRQTTQAAIAQAGIGLAVQHLVEADAEAGQHLAAEFFDAQVGQVVAQRAAHQEFHGEVIQALGILVAVARLGLEHAVDNAVADGEGDGLQVVGGLQFRGGTNQGVANVAQDGFAKHFGRPDLRKKFRG